MEIQCVIVEQKGSKWDQLLKTCASSVVFT